MNTLGTIDQSRLSEWLSKLVQIPSVTPHQPGPRAGVVGEQRIATQLAAWLAALGGEVHLDEVLPGRTNVMAIFKGESDRWLAVDTHMDTVGVEQMIGNPFSGDVADGCVYGRGSADTKGSLAVSLALLESMQKSRVRSAHNLLIAGTVDEEVGAQGAPAFARWVREQGIKLDQLIVAEPTMCGPVYGHKGLSRLCFEVRGKPAHSSQPQLGQNAITAAARLVLALDAEANRLLSTPPTTALGNATLTVSLITGGRGINVVPDSCQVSLDRRVLPDEKPAQVSAALITLAQSSSPLPMNVTVFAEVDAFLQSPDSPWIQQLADWSACAPDVAPYCTNAWAYGGLARECVILGPGNIAQAHGTQEWVEVSQLEKLARMYSQWWGVS